MRSFSRFAFVGTLVTIALALIFGLFTPNVAAQSTQEDNNCLKAEIAPVYSPTIPITGGTLLSWTWVITNTGSCDWGVVAPQVSITVFYSPSSGLPEGTFIFSPSNPLEAPVGMSRTLTLSGTAPQANSDYSFTWGLQAITKTVAISPEIGEVAFTVSETVVLVPSETSTLKPTETATTRPSDTPTSTPNQAATEKSTKLPKVTPSQTPTLAPSKPANVSSAGPLATSAPTSTAPETPTSPLPDGSLSLLLGIGAIVLAVLAALSVILRRGKSRPPKPDKVAVVLPPPLMTGCPQCKTLNKAEANYCKQCRTPLRAEAIIAQTTPPGPVDAGTKPLTKTDAEQPAFAPLSKDTLIGQQRYRVLDVVNKSNLLNRYRVEDQQPLIICPQCGSGNPPDSNFCYECRNSIQGLVSFKPQYLVKEASQADRVQTESALAQLSLTHARVIPPRAAFVEQVAGVARYYVVLEDPTWGTAAQITPPHEAAQVFAWGIGLAEGLDYLHQRHVVMNALRGTEIALLGKEARWADFETARIVPDEEWTRIGTQATSNDAHQLAALLYRLVTGLPQYDPSNRTLAPKANTVFGKILADTTYLTASGLAEALREAEQNVRRPGGIDVSVARLSDVGQERDLDEDSILTVELGQVYRSVSTPLGVYAVADGMGGHEGGDVASRLAIRAIARMALTDIVTPVMADGTPPADFEGWLKRAVLEANKAVLTQRKASRNDMGTTLVMAVVLNDLAYIAHVGDSRAYLIRNNEIRQLTTDHSLVERLIATGQITREEAATHPQRNVIYKNIGDKPQVEPDILRLNLMPGDTLLLCCDGLSGEISDSQILQIVMQYPALPVACRELIRAANVAGGHDNISVVLIEVVATV